jgi:hypothetical protein
MAKVKINKSRVATNSAFMPQNYLANVEKNGELSLRLCLCGMNARCRQKVCSLSPFFVRVNMLRARK